VVGEGRRRLSWQFVLVLFVLLCAAFSLLAYGIFQESFIFDLKGLAGLALGSERRSAYSLMSIGYGLRSSGDNEHGIGILLLQVAYFFYSVLTPFACLLCLLALVTIPMSLKRQQFVLTLAEISNAWSAVEVFAFSVVCCVLEISAFSQFIIDHRCDVINEILDDYVDDKDEATCYSVHATLSWNVLFLLLGALLNSLVVSVSLRIVNLAVKERLRAASKMPERDTFGRSRQISVVAFLAENKYTAWAVTNLLPLTVNEAETQRLLDSAGESHVSSVNS
jgi:hypothetical protein